jgi:hypothetical protein
MSGGRPGHETDGGGATEVRGRRFGVGDLMIVVAVVAVGSPEIRTTWALWKQEVYCIRRHLRGEDIPPTPPRYSTSPPAQPFSWGRSLGSLISAGLRLPFAGIPVTAPPAVLLMRLRRPRPPLRRLATEPGAVACAAVLLGLLQGSLRGIWLETRPILFAPPWVAVAWAVLWLSGRWRPGRDWIDRLGQVVGFGWFALGVMGLAVWLRQSFG